MEKAILIILILIFGISLYEIGYNQGFNKMLREYLGKTKNSEYITVDKKHYETNGTDLIK